MSTSRKTCSNYARVKTTSDTRNVLDSKNLVKKGVKVLGFVSKNHGSTIVKKHKSRYGKTYYSYEGSTHQLSQKTQAALAYQLDQPGVSKSILFEEGAKNEK